MIIPAVMDDLGAAVAVSGGKDSAYLLALSNAGTGIQVDTGYMAPIALANAEHLCRTTKRSLIVVRNYAPLFAVLYRWAFENGRMTPRDLCPLCTHLMHCILLNTAQDIHASALLVGVTPECKSLLPPEDKKHFIPILLREIFERTNWRAAFEKLQSPTCCPDKPSYPLLDININPARITAYVRRNKLLLKSSPLSTNCRINDLMIYLGFQQGRGFVYDDLFRAAENSGPSARASYRRKRLLITLARWSGILGYRAQRVLRVLRPQNWRRHDATN